MAVAEVWCSWEVDPLTGPLAPRVHIGSAKDFTDAAESSAAGGRCLEGAGCPDGALRLLPPPGDRPRCVLRVRTVKAMRVTAVELVGSARNIEVSGCRTDAPAAEEGDWECLGTSRASPVTAIAGAPLYRCRLDTGAIDGPWTFLRLKAIGVPSTAPHVLVASVRITATAALPPPARPLPGSGGGDGGMERFAAMMMRLGPGLPPPPPPASRPPSGAPSCEAVDAASLLTTLQPVIQAEVDRRVAEQVQALTLRLRSEFDRRVEALERQFAILTTPTAPATPVAAAAAGSPASPLHPPDSCCGIPSEAPSFASSSPPPPPPGDEAP